MLRLVLIVLGWPLVVLLIVSSVLWYRDRYPESPDDIVLEPPRIRAAQHTAEAALEGLRTLPPVEQQRLLNRLERAVTRPRPWVEALARTEYRILCLGEHHEPSTRQFLAETFFSRYSVDVLLVEATPAELARIDQWLADGREYVPLLNADIGDLLQTVRRRNPDAAVRGIEETPAQVRSRKDREGSRDRTLARNFWQSWQPGQRNVILYGALHCADESTWLYRHLREQMPAREDVAMRNIRVVGAHQHAPTLAFVTFLRELDIEDGDFVVPETDAIPSEVRRWFGVLDQHILQRYDSVIVFRHSARGLAARGTAAGEPVANAPGSKDTLP